MKLYCRSATTGIEYCPEDSIHLVNPKQVLFYICRGVTIQDVFPSRKYDDGEKTLVFCVNKKESHCAYQEWLVQTKLDASILEDISLTKPSADEVFVLNIKQVIFYLNHKAKLLGMYPIMDWRSHDPVLAFAFNKQDTKEIFHEWKQNKARA